jgi:hypothetical protein
MSVFGTSAHSLAGHYFGLSHILLVLEFRKHKHNNMRQWGGHSLAQGQSIVLVVDSKAQRESVVEEIKGQVQNGKLVVFEQGIYSLLLFTSPSLNNLEVYLFVLHIAIFLLFLSHVRSLAN